jgi:hypothetical protein
MKINKIKQIYIYLYVTDDVVFQKKQDEVIEIIIIKNIMM